MASPAPRLITVEEFLDGLTDDSERLELIEGSITAMVGGTLAASRVARNILGGLHGRLRGGPCEAFGDNTVLRVDEHNALVPDAMIVCSSPAAQDRYVSDPVVIVEVLSPSTETLDRGFKWLRYQTMPSLRHYLLVAQDQRLVEVFSRGRDGPWLYEAIREPEAEIGLAAVDVRLPLAEIHEGVTPAA